MQYVAPELFSVPQLVQWMTEVLGASDEVVAVWLGMAGDTT